MSDGWLNLSNVQFNPKLWNRRPIRRRGWRVQVHYQISAPSIRVLSGVTSSAFAPRIGAAQDVEERIWNRSEGMEPRFISWNAAALHSFDLTFPDMWSRKKIKAIPSRKTEVSAGHWNEVCTPTDDKSRLKWPRRETVVMQVSQGKAFI